MARAREREQSPASPFDRYIIAHLDHVRALNYAEETIKFKNMALRQFTLWCAERGIARPSEVTRPVLQRYQRHLYHAQGRGGRPLSAGAQFNRLMALRGFFKYLTRENVLLYNPASELDLPRLERRLPKDVLTADEAERVLSQPDINTPLGVRDRAILEMLYSTGIRRMELIRLERRQVEPERGVILIRQGKGKKDRYVPIGARALLWLDKYLADVRPEHETADVNTLFLESSGERLDHDRLSRFVRGYIEASGVGKKGRCHLFRHTMATLMLEGGADIRYIQQILGHVKLETTEIYTHVSIFKLKEIHTLTHPARLPESAAQALRAHDGGSAGGARVDAGARAERHDRDTPTADDLLAALDAEADEEDGELHGDGDDERA